MGSEFAQFAGSLAAVATLVALTYFLGFRKDGQIKTIEEARHLFRLAPGGFEPVEIALDAEGRGAIARDDEGRLALLVPHGSQFIVRPIPAGTTVVARDGRLVIEGLASPTLFLGEDAGGWATTDSDANSG
ncbi:hypothetical protein [Aurantiacibacter hainanensis]|uniref:hypothetical protein n=1 Tax=Aurantiacibacter hainanensis TaxID=3076114 RepID=UPI0030C75917